jgi:hypothetical protein
LIGLTWSLACSLSAAVQVLGLAEHQNHVDGGVWGGSNFSKEEMLGNKTKQNLAAAVYNICKNSNNKNSNYFLEARDC